MTVALVLLFVVALAALAVVGRRLLRPPRATPAAAEQLEVVPAEEPAAIASAPTDENSSPATEEPPLEADASPIPLTAVVPPPAPPESPPAPSSVAEVESVPTAAVPPRAATLGEAHALARLFVKPATAYELAEKLGCSPRWARACLQHLEQQGYVTRIGGELWVSRLALDDLRRALGPAASS